MNNYELYSKIVPRIPHANRKKMKHHIQNSSPKPNNFGFEKRIGSKT